MKERQAQYLDSYIQVLRSEKYYSPHTCKNYRRDLDNFSRYLHDHDITQWTKVDFFQVNAYAAYRFRNGLKSSSIQRELSSIRGLYQYLMRESLVKSNPAKGVGRQSLISYCQKRAMPNRSDNFCVTARQIAI
jgi:integrase/recombinase XerC